MATSYPFISKREVTALLASDAAFVRRAFALLAEHTAAGAGGFMASHRSRARQLAPLIGHLVDGELLERAAWLSSYARTLSRVLREEQLAGDPTLREKALVFGIVGPDVTHQRHRDDA